ncbi:MAG TPA: ureidoglycolate lyase [Firmicutes bacterium]|nr:ureidoglycolate lyase [Bacillota bacterium]
MKTIKVQKLTKEAFAPYGEVLTTEGREAGGNPATHQWYPQAVIIDAPTSINLMRVLQHDFVLKDFEAHDHTTENLIAMDGDLIVGMAAAGDLKEENVTAFYIPCGLGISLKPSVWHAVPMAVGKDVMSVCIFKNNTSHDDIYFASLPEDIGLML